MRWVLGALLALLLAAPARADVYDDNPATASRGPGDTWVFVRGKDGDVLMRHYDGSYWTDWSSLGGEATSGPAAAAYGDQLFVFVRGTDGALYSRHLGSNGWSRWESLGGYLTSAPAAALRRGTGYLDVVVRAGDNSFAMRSYTAGGGWGGWGALGGAFTSAPAIASYQGGALNVWGRGTDGALYVRGYEGAWNEWTSFGGQILGAPTAVSRSAGFENIYVRDIAYGVQQRAWVSGNPWSGYLPLDARPIDSAPAAAGDGPGREWLFARDGDHLLYKEWTATYGFGPWLDSGPIAVPSAAGQVPPPAPIPTPAGDVTMRAGTGCTPTGTRLRVRISVKQVKGRMVRVTFFTKGKGHTAKTDKRAPFDVRLMIKRPAGSKGRVYARLYYRAKGRIHKKTVSGRYLVCP